MLREAKRRTLLMIGGGIILLVLFVAMIVPKSMNIATAAVEMGEFIIDLGAKGEIDALNSTNISVPRMHRRMSLQIVEMAEEGTIVK